MLDMVYADGMVQLRLRLDPLQGCLGKEGPCRLGGQEHPVTQAGHDDVRLVTPIGGCAPHNWLAIGCSPQLETEPVLVWHDVGRLSKSLKSALTLFY